MKGRYVVRWLKCLVCLCSRPMYCPLRTASNNDGVVYWSKSFQYITADSGVRKTIAVVRKDSKFRSTGCVWIRCIADQLVFLYFEPSIVSGHIIALSIFLFWSFENGSCAR